MGWVEPGPHEPPHAVANPDPAWGRSPARSSLLFCPLAPAASGAGAWGGGRGRGLGPRVTWAPRREGPARGSGRLISASRVAGSEQTTAWRATGAGVRPHSSRLLRLPPPPSGSSRPHLCVRGGVALSLCLFLPLALAGLSRSYFPLLCSGRGTQAFSALTVGINGAREAWRKPRRAELVGSPVPSPLSRRSPCGRAAPSRSCALFGRTG